VIFLDPAERGLAMGQIAADYEGTQALVFDYRKPQLITLPTTPFDSNQRDVTLELALDAEGKLSGSGTVTLTGHHAAERIAEGLEGGAEKVWADWLKSRFTGFEIQDLKISEAVEDRRISATFNLAQVDEEVLGDEASFQPSRPLGPVRQVLPTPAEQRRTPVQFDYGDRNTLELSLSWPEGWQLAGKADDSNFDDPVGAFTAATRLEPENRKLSYSRRFDLKAASFSSREEYARLRALYGEVAKHDAQMVLLVRQ
jgi:hypothetical protein